jgi:hypothetical protein
MMKLTRADVANRLAAAGFDKKFRLRNIEVMGKDGQELTVLDVTKEEAPGLHAAYEAMRIEVKRGGGWLIYKPVAPKDAPYAYVGGGAKC